MRKRMICAVLASVLLLGIIVGCKAFSEKKPTHKPSQYTSYRDIPGITDAEIQAIEKLKNQDGSLVYGMLPSTEMFYDLQSGDLKGYSVLFCQWMTEMFGIEFKPALYEWGDLLAGLKSGKIAFSGELTPSEERRKRYFMTEAIAARSVKAFRLSGSEPIPDITKSRPVRYIFLGGSTTIADVTARLHYKYEIILVYDYDSAYKKLKSGEGDIFIAEGNVEAAFVEHADIAVSYFLPLIHSPVSLTTQSPELAPIVSVMQKALDDGVFSHLTELYRQGEKEYRRHKLYSMLNEEERAYIRNNPIIPVVTEHSNYPISFYNKYEKIWQGVFCDVIAEMSELTGLKFMRMNDDRTDWSEMLRLLESGKAYMVSELMPTEERKAKGFLWPATPTMVDYYALLSKLETPNIDLKEVFDVKVALPRDTIYAEIFWNWFPYHQNTVYYDGSDGAFSALERGEVDMVMSSQRRLLAITNYHEYPGYKANLVFDRASESYFGFNKDHAVLCSIFNKAFTLINIKVISEQWSLRTYDYKGKIAQAQVPWLIGASALLLCVLVLLSIILVRKQHEERRLESLVQYHTAELTLRTAKLEAVINNYKGIIWSVDTEGTITTFNGQYLKTIGAESSFCIGKNIEVARLKNRHLDIIANIEKTFNEGPQSWIAEIDNGIFQSCTVPLHDKEGKVIGVVGSTDDVTEMIKLQQDLKNASRAKSDFLSNMSHEIRTPMNAIIGMTTIAMSATSIERAKHCLSKINDASRHLLGIINNILDISKIEANKFELSLVNFDFERMLQKVVNVINFRMDKRRQKFHVRIDKNIPQMLIGDDQRLTQVITNLLSNAVKFTPEEGTITLEARLVSEVDGVCCLQISVKDTGIGISKEQKKRIFVSFEQAEAGTSRKFGGTGLGLAIAKRIMEMMDGDIQVESELGHGSTFTLTVNLRTEERKRLLGDGINWSNLRIFAVDDDPEVRRFFTEILKDLGINCRVAASGEEASDVLTQEYSYDIFFIDWKLPGISGTEFAQRIRSKMGNKSIVILFSSADRNLVENDAQAVGVDKFLQKPLFRSDILDIIKECIGINVVAHTEQDEEPKREDFTGNIVLLAEDISVNREVVYALLGPMGLLVECAENGAQAVEMFKAAPDRYDIIFMDVQMPEMDGNEATRIIRALEIPRAKEIPIIAMTANVFKEDVEKCIASGMNGHIGKPLDFEEVVKQLRRYLNPSA